MRQRFYVYKETANECFLYNKIIVYKIGTINFLVLSSCTIFCVVYHKRFFASLLFSGRVSYLFQPNLWTKWVRNHSEY